MGPPRFETATGRRVPISSKKGLALLATLATADRFERSRVWLQQVLWGSRAQTQAQSSLRRELSNLRTIFNAHGIDVLDCDHRTVTLKAERIHVDFAEPRQGAGGYEFCEGIDLVQEEGFEDWLRDMRSGLTAPAMTSDRPMAAERSRAVPASLLAQIAISPTEFDPAAPHVECLARRTESALLQLLPRLRWLPVVAPEITRSSDKLSANVAAQMDRLNARYIVQSHIMDTHDQPTIRFTLLEMPERIIRWTDTRRIDGDGRSDQFDAEIARAANCIGASFDICEQRHASEDDYCELANPARLNWRIRFHINQFTCKSFDRAETLIGEGMAQHPEDCELLMLRANLALWRHWISRSDDRTSAQLAPLIHAAMRADPSDARGPLFHGVLDTWHRRDATALRHLNHACELDPSLAQAFAHLGSAHYLMGDPQSAIEPLQHALFLAPLDAKRFFPLGELAMAYWMLERHDDAIELAQQIQATHPGYVLAHIIETAAQHSAGRFGEAAQARAKMLDRKPAIYRAVLDWLPFREKKWSEKLRQAVEYDRRKAPRLFAVADNRTSL